jgi:hypothetical protein
VRLLFLVRDVLNDLDQHKRISRTVASDLPEPSTIIPFDRHVYIQVAKSHRRSCQQCAYNRIQDRRAGRLVEPSNTIRRTQWKCAICLVSLCKDKQEGFSGCWKQYHSDSSGKTSGSTGGGDAQFRKARRKVEHTIIQKEKESERDNVKESEEDNESHRERENETQTEKSIERELQETSEKDNHKDINKDSEEEETEVTASLEHEAL